MLETVRPARRRLSTLRLPRHSTNSRRLKSILSSSTDCSMRRAVCARFRAVVLTAWAEASSVPSLGEEEVLANLTGGFLERNSWGTRRAV
jgi:hypothetical protein